VTHIKADDTWRTRCGLDLGNADAVWARMPTAAEVKKGARATCKRCLATIKHVKG
jgi:hypothetical protein